MGHCDTAVTSKVIVLMTDEGTMGAPTCFGFKCPAKSQARLFWLETEFSNNNHCSVT
jgi:hypothetical protein